MKNATTMTFQCQADLAETVWTAGVVKETDATVVADVFVTGTQHNLTLISTVA